MMHKFKFFDGFIENTFVFDDLNMYAIPVQGGERTLRARWTPELLEDLNAVHTIDATAELTRLMSEQIAREVDNDIVRRLIDIINIDNETDEEVIRGVNTLNGDNNLDYLNRWLDIGNDIA